MRRYVVRFQKLLFGGVEKIFYHRNRRVRSVVVSEATGNR